MGIQEKIKLEMRLFVIRPKWLLLMITYVDVIKIVWPCHVRIRQIEAPMKRMDRMKKYLVKKVKEDQEKLGGRF